MGTAINLAEQNLFYRVRHPEFDPTKAYKAIAYVDYGESAWSQLLFINERGMTYSVKVNRALCINAYCDGRLGSVLLIGCNIPDSKIPVVVEIGDHDIVALPWPKPRAANPDLDDD